MSTSPKKTASGLPLRFVKKRQASEMYGISVDTLERAMRKGDLPYRKLPGGSVLLSIEELDAYFNQYRVA